MSKRVRQVPPEPEGAEGDPEPVPGEPVEARGQPEHGMDIAADDEEDRHLQAIAAAITDLRVTADELANPEAAEALKRSLGSLEHHVDGLVQVMANKTRDNTNTAETKTTTPEPRGRRPNIISGRMVLDVADGAMVLFRHVGPVLEEPRQEDFPEPPWNVVGARRNRRPRRTDSTPLEEEHSEATGVIPPKRLPKPPPPRIPRDELIVVADLLRSVKGAVSPSAVGTSVHSIRKGAGNRLEIRLRGGATEAATLTTTLQQKMQGSAVRLAGQTAYVHIKDLDQLATVEEIQAVVRTALGPAGEAVVPTVTSLRPAMGETRLPQYDSPAPGERPCCSREAARGMGVLSCPPQDAR